MKCAGCVGALNASVYWVTTFLGTTFLTVLWALRCGVRFLVVVDFVVPALMPGLATGAVTGMAAGAGAATGAGYATAAGVATTAGATAPVTGLVTGATAGVCAKVPAAARPKKVIVSSFFIMNFIKASCSANSGSTRRFPRMVTRKLGGIAKMRVRVLCAYDLLPVLCVAASAPAQRCHPPPRRAGSVIPTTPARACASLVVKQCRGPR